MRASAISTTSNIKTVNQNKKKGLQIVTLNESLQNKAALSQPTATFAMQRERVNQQNSFVFKNKGKQYQDYNLPIEEYALQFKEDNGRPTKRETYESVSEDFDESYNSSIADNNPSFISHPKIVTGVQKDHLVKAFYYKEML